MRHKGDRPRGWRVHEIHWNPEGYRYTQCLNLPIQGICADISMLALAMIDRWLFEAGIDGGPVAWLHDEIVLEVPVAVADKSAALLRKAMTEAFLESLPGAPTRGLVEPTIGQTWAERREARARAGAADRTPIWENTESQGDVPRRGIERKFAVRVGGTWA